MKRRISSLIIIFVIMSIFAFACTGTTSSNYSSASDELLLKDEYYLGKAVASIIFQDYPYLNNKEVNDYVRLIGSTIAVMSEAHDDIYSNYAFTLIDTNELVAYAAPKGFIIISTGLMKACENEDEFAGIVALMIGLNIGNYPIESLPAEYKQKMNYAMDNDDADLLSSTFLEAVEYMYDGMNDGYPSEEIFFADGEAIRMLSEVGYSIDTYKSIIQKLSTDGSPQMNIFDYNIEGREDIINGLIDEYGPSADITPARTERFLEMLAKLN
jgi:beta-barrel assembly-enhancing protease